MGNQLGLFTTLDVRKDHQVRASGYYSFVGTQDGLVQYLIENEYEVLIACVPISDEQADRLCNGPAGYTRKG